MKVWPKNDEIRRVIYHPTGNIHFPAEGPSDWPEDQYTARRIRDGDVTASDPGAERHSTKSKSETE
jgi:hypothetical protein